ncbi:nicotinate phosphoribosyltransferase [Sporomusa sphaeroides]|uniref:nicotinate phosphoribosyltransferase n=1 Tax=Sporomusa sphaeroides TaxID=47679 RepID=UPI003DA0159A
MSIFNNKRLPEELFLIDAERIRQGWYSDKYFCNNVELLEKLAAEKYHFQGESDLKDIDCSVICTGNIEVEMQFFTRRRPFSVVAGVDEALAILKQCAGYYAENGQFVNTYNELEVEAVQDGTFVTYDGDPKQVVPVIKVRGNHRYFAKLETVMLGAIAEPTRIATNVFNTLVAARNKEVLFFPARFTPYKIQALHGYAYSLGIDAYNKKYGKKNGAFVSTDSGAAYWSGSGVGTISHSTIASFCGDTAEAMYQFARLLHPAINRIALVDFHNDCVGESKKVMKRLWDKYLELYQNGNLEEARQYKLFGVRPDTSATMRDKSIVPTGNKSLDMGVSPKLVWNIREGLDNAYLEWNVPAEYLELAKEYCKDVKIFVTGGFNVKKIREFEEQDVPVDFYGVGSSLIENSPETNNDFTADIVRIKVGNDWHNLAKIGRCACTNPELELIR